MDKASVTDAMNIKVMNVLVMQRTRQSPTKLQVMVSIARQSICESCAYTSSRYLAGMGDDMQKRREKSQ